MKSLVSALIVAAGVAGFAAGAQASPVAASMPLGVATQDSPIVHAQYHRERRIMRHRMMRHRMIRRHIMHRRMMHRM